AVMDAPRQARGHLSHRILAIDADEIGESREHGGIGEHLRLDALMQRLFPGVEDISERLLLLRLALGGTRRSRCRSQLWCPLLGCRSVRERHNYTALPPLGRQSELTVNLYDW